MYRAADLQQIPEGLPVPQDDGACRHLLDAPLPELTLLKSEPFDSERTTTTQTPTTSLSLSSLQQPTVIFFYPRTGLPVVSSVTREMLDQWDLIPGARGCTPQSCSYRSLYSEFERLGVQVLGCSTQPPAYHREFIDRNHLPFGIVSDSDLQLVRALRLPTFEAPFVYGDEPTTLIKRMAWVVLGGRIAHVEYPVFPPDRNASVVLDWLRQHLGQEASS